MIQLTYYEIVKLIKRKSFWMLISAILICNCLLVYVVKNVNDADNLRNDWFHKVFMELQEVPVEEAQKYLKDEQEYYEVSSQYSLATQYPEYYEMPNISKEQIQLYEETKNDLSYYVQRREVIDELTSYYENIGNYSNYLKGIDKNVSTLSNSPMWLLMSETEKEDVLIHASFYDKLSDLKIEPSYYTGIENYTNSMISKLMSLLVVCAIAVLVLKEDEENMEELLYSTSNGHIHTIWAKTIGFIILSFGCVGIIQCVDLGLHLSLYGMCDMSSIIQSIPSFYESPMYFTVAQWLVTSILYFSICISLYGILFMFLYHIFASKIASMIVFFLFFVVEAILYTLIQENSFFVFLSHVNILRLFEGTLIGTFLSYQHLLFIRIPTYVSIGLFCLGIAIVAIVLFIKYYNRKIGKKEIRIKAYIVRNLSVLRQEGNRILQTNKAYIFLLVFVLVFTGMYVSKYKDQKTIEQNEQEKYQIYEKYAGEISEEISLELEVVMLSFVEVENTYANAKQLYKQNAVSYDELMKAKEEYEIILKDYSTYKEVYGFIESGYSYIVYNNGHNALFGILNPNRDLVRCALLILFVMLLASASVYHNEEEKLYVTTFKGVNQRRNALLICIFVLTMIMFVLSEVMEYMYIISIYPIQDMKVSMELLYTLESTPLPAYLQNMSAITYMICLCLVRLFAFISVFMISMGIYRISKNKILGLLTCMLIFFMPMFLYYNGFTFMIHFSLFDISMGNLFIKDTFSLVRIVCVIALDVVCGWYIVKSFKQENY